MECQNTALHVTKIEIFGCLRKYCFRDRESSFVSDFANSVDVVIRAERVRSIEVDLEPNQALCGRSEIPSPVSPFRSAVAAVYPTGYSLAGCLDRPALQLNWWSFLVPIGR